MATSAGGGFPSWVLLEPFVFRRNDDESFPDDTKAPIRASGTTSWGADFRIAFSFVEPPRISRLYAQLPVPGFLDRKKADPLAILATHSNLALLRVATETPACRAVQNFFIYTAGDENLRALPACMEPGFHGDGRRRPAQDASSPRLLAVGSMGLLCRGEDEFVVAELTVHKPANMSKVIAHICRLQSSCISSTDDGRELGGTWNSMCVDIQGSSNPGDFQQLCCWQTDTVIPFRHWLCWIDYNEGILFCDVLEEPTPSVSFLRSPLLDELPRTNTRATPTRSYLYRGVSVVDQGRELKFVNVTRHDGLAFGALKPGTGFTITCHTLMLSAGGSMAWEEDYTVTSGELWEANTPERLPRGILMFPRVDVEKPYVVHFLFIEFGYVNKKMWVVSVDMSTKIVESFSLYINGKEGLKTDDADLIKEKSKAPMPFLPCEFPKFLHLSRERKDME